jgi:hypothetical protein
MREATIKVYRFEELTEKAQQKVIDWYTEGDTTVGLRLDELFDMKAADHHLQDAEFRWSLSHSQGDGVSFLVKSWTYPSDELLKALGDFDKWKGLRDTLNVRYKVVFTNSRYGHENTMRVELDHEDPSPEEGESLNEMEQSLLEYFRGVAKELEKAGYEELEYCRSKEYVQEACEANDYEFHLDGRVFEE